MKTVIRRKVRPNRIFYLTEHANIHCECNTTYGFLLRKILLSNEKGLILRLQQENWLLGLLSSIPPFSFYNLPNYVLYKNNTKIGYTKALRKAYNKTLFCANDEYLFTLHGNNYVSILKNGVQCALVQKEYLSVMEENIYQIEYEKDIPYELIVLLVSYIDVVYFRITSNKYNGLKWEKTIMIGRDKDIDRLQWKSNDADKNK